MRERRGLREGDRGREREGGREGDGEREGGGRDGVCVRGRQAGRRIERERE